MSAHIVRLRQIDGIVFASSLDVANDFARRHDNILRDVEEISQNISSDLRRSWFQPDNYYDRHGRRQRCILMAEEGWQLVVMNIQGMYDWKVAYILEFKRMRDKLNKLLPRDNIVAFPPSPQGELFSVETPPQAELAVVDPLREEAELEAELQRYNDEFGYETALPKGLIAVDEKQRRAYLFAWRKKYSDMPRNQLDPAWDEWWQDALGDYQMGPGGIPTKRYDF
jgi:Rha family phage regulatory protein